MLLERHNIKQLYTIRQLDRPLIKLQRLYQNRMHMVCCECFMPKLGTKRHKCRRLEITHTK